MGLMTASGPFGPKPAGRFNFRAPASARALYLDPSPKRVRAVVAGEAVADSSRTVLLHESGHQPIYYFPPSDVRSDLLEPTDHHTFCPKKGRASYYSIRVGDRVVENAAWYYPDPIDTAPAGLKGLIAFYWRAIDQWLEEDEEVFGHARDPYHRVDILESSRHVRVSLDGSLLAETRRAVAVFESNLPPRWYMPREDVVGSLESSDTVTRCPYKGLASYWSVPGFEDGRDLVWSYADPIPEASRLAGLVCFFNERVDLELDGELVDRPESPWRHPVSPSADRPRVPDRSRAARG
jgi:uncharacterized protein (DUF427 family)